METIHAACNAMATRFEMVLQGDNPVALRAAAEEAFQEVERLHSQLSLYDSSSEVSFINRHAARRAVQVEPRLFQLLTLAQRIHRETSGAFDITIAPLLRCWGFMGGSGALPSPAQIEEARTKIGMQHVILDEPRSTIRFERDGMMIDLGSIGKGYALEVAMEILMEAGVPSALVHGGTSTVCALGTPAEAEAWKVAIDYPPGMGAHQPSEGAEAAEAKRPLAVVELKGEALSVSGVHGKSFTAGGRTYGHVLDPRTGYPAPVALLAAVVLPSATETDAFSTALLLAGAQDHERVANLRPGMRTLVLEKGPTTPELRVAARGLAPLMPAWNP